VSANPSVFEDADFGKWLRLLTAFTNIGTYRCAIVARKLVKVGPHGLTLVVRTIVAR